MADTQQSSVLWDQKAWEQMAYFAFFPENYYDQLATVRATNETHRGSSISFSKVTSMSPATTPLTETSDVTPVEVVDDEVNITMTEYGNVTRNTAKLRGTSFLPVNETLARAVGYNMGETIDLIARVPFYAGSNVAYGTGGTGTPDSRANVNAADTLDPHDIRAAVAELRADAVPTLQGSYVSVIHPHVYVDFVENTDAAGWTTPANYSDSTRRWNGEIGTFEGVRFINSPRAKIFTDTGSPTTVDVYATCVIGAEAVGKAYSKHPEWGEHPQMVQGPIVDALRRFVPIGWKHLVGYGIFRQESLWRIESGSSLGV